MTEDRDLVRRMLRGDEAAFEEVFANVFPPLYRFALARLGGDPDAAEEVVQETLCKAIRKLATYRGEAPLLGWLCTFCRHEVGHHLRRRGSRPVPLAEDDPEIQAVLAALAGEADPAAGALRADLERLVQATLDALPQRYGDVLEWKYLEGAPVQEIAHRLGSSFKAAESLLTRARQAFRAGFLALGGVASWEPRP